MSGALCGPTAGSERQCLVRVHACAELNRVASRRGAAGAHECLYAVATDALALGGRVRVASG